MYRIIYRGGEYQDVDYAPGFSAKYMFAVINLEILEGGDAYQALLSTLTD